MARLFDIREDDLSGEQTRELLALHLAGMHANSPPGSVFALDLSGLQGPEMTVWTAWRGERVAAVGAVKMLEDGTAEVKSMRTHPDFVRMGAGSAILETIIGAVTDRGVRRLSLETGSGPAFDPAIALYRRRGFENGPAFGGYDQSAFNQFLHLDLVGAERSLSTRSTHKNVDRHVDGSAGDADYGRIGVGYTRYRQPDPHIAEFLRAALGDARSVINVGAGAGSYEPVDREVTAVEPSASMRAQRPAHLPSAIDAVAEKLPFADQSFDAAMATFTVHQWPDLRAGLGEIRRVTRGPIVILTCDPLELNRSWLAECAPEMIAVEARRYPLVSDIVEGMGGKSEVLAVPIPLNCTDGFSEAYYGRPERLLESGARLANSAWSFVDPDVEPRIVAKLEQALQSGEWDAKYGHLRIQPFFEGSLRLIVGKR